MLDQHQNKFQLKNIFSAKRLIFEQQPGGTPEKGSAEKPAPTPSAAEAPKKPEVVDQRTEALKAVRESSGQSISTLNTSLRLINSEISPDTQKYLEQYFTSSIDRFDADKDGKIDATEAAEYKKKMMEKVGQIVQESTPSEKEKAAKAEMDKSGKEASKGMEKPIPELGEVAKLGKMDLQKALPEFENLQAQTASLQTSVNNSIAVIGDFQKNLATFEQSKQGFTNSLSRVWTRISTEDEGNRMAELQRQLDAAKAKAAKTLADLTAKKAILDENGESIKAAIAEARKQIIEDRDKKIKEIESQKDTQSKEVQERQAKRKEISEKQSALEKQRAGLTAKQEKNSDFRKKWEAQKQEEALPTRLQSFQEGFAAASAELGAMEVIFNDPHTPPELKEALRTEYLEVEARQKSNQGNIKVTQEKIKTGKDISEQLDADEKAGAAELQSVDAHLEKTVKPSLASLTSNIDRLESLKLQYATTGKEVAEFYNKKVDQINQIDQAVADGVLTGAMSRVRSIDSLKKASDSINSTTISKDGFLSVLVGVPQGVFHSIGEGCHSLAKTIDNNTGELLDNTSGGWHGLTQVAGVFTGFLSGGLELVGGVSTMVAHPVDTVKGMGALIGRDPATKEWSLETLGRSWKQLGGALIGGEELQKGHYGTAAGKTIFNVLSMFVGAGETGAAGKAATASKLARIAAIDAVKATGREAGMFTGRMAEAGAFFKTFGVEAGRSIISIPKNAVGGINNFGKGVKDAVKGVSESAAKETAGLGYKMGSGIVEGTKFTVKHPILATGKVIVGVGKGVGTVVSTGLEVVGTIGRAAVDGIGGIGRAVREIPNLARRIRSEGMVNVYRAAKVNEAVSVMAKESAAYAKTEQSVAKIIREDAELTKLADAGGESAVRAEQYALERLAKEDLSGVNSYLKYREASAQLQESSAAFAQDTLKTAKKIQSEKGLQEAYEAYQGAKSDPAKLAAFEKDPAKMAKVERYEAALQLEEEVSGLLKEQSELFKPTNKPITTPELIEFEKEVAEARLAVKPTPEQTEKIKIYQEYQKALQENNPQVRLDLKKAHPKLEEVFNQLDQRQTFIFKHQDLTHRLGAQRIKSEIDQVLKSKMTPEQAAEALQKRYSGQPMGMGEKSLPVGEVMLNDGKSYKIRLSQNGKVELLDDTGKVIETARDKAAARAAAKRRGAQPVSPETTVPESVATAEAAAASSEVVAPVTAETLEASLKAAQKKLKNAQAASRKAATASDRASQGVTAARESVANITSDLQKAQAELAQATEKAKLYDLKFKPDHNFSLEKDLASIESGSTVAFGTGQEGGHWVEITRLSNGDYHIVRVTDNKFAAEMKIPAGELHLRPTSGAPGKFELIGVKDSKLLDYQGITEVYQPAKYFSEEHLATLAKDSSAAVDSAKASIQTSEAGLKTAQEALTEAESKASAAQAKAAEKTSAVDQARAARDQAMADLQVAKKSPATTTVTPEAATTAPAASTAATAPTVEAQAAKAAPAATSEAAAPTVEAQAAKAAPAATPEAAAAAAKAEATGLPATAESSSFETAAIREKIEQTRQGIAEAKSNLAAEEAKLKPAKAEVQRLEKDLRDLNSRASTKPEYKLRLQEQLSAAKEEVANIEKSIGSHEVRLREARYAYGEAKSARWEAYGDRAKTYLSEKFTVIKNLSEKLKNAPPTLYGKTKAIASSLSESLIKQLEAGKAGLTTTVVEQGSIMLAKLRRAWEASKTTKQPFPELYNETLNEQLRLIAQLSRVAANDNAILSMSTAEKLQQLEQGLKQVASLDPKTPDQLFYNEQDLQKIGGIRQKATAALENYMNTENPTQADLEAALNVAIGFDKPREGQSYNFTLDGIEVNIASDGTISYQGTEKWTTDLPKKKEVAKSFAEASEKYAKMSPGQLQRLNGGKPIKTAQELQSFVQQKLSEQAQHNLQSANLDVSGGLTVFSRQKDQSNKPNFTVVANQDGKTFSSAVSEEWSGKTFAAIEKRGEEIRLAAARKRQAELRQERLAKLEAEKAEAAKAAAGKAAEGSTSSPQAAPPTSISGSDQPVNLDTASPATPAEQPVAPTAGAPKDSTKISPDAYSEEADRSSDQVA